MKLLKQCSKTKLVCARTKEIDFREGNFTVGSQFDPKELVFRNTLNALGETSRPEVMYTLGPDAASPNFTARVVVIDPLDRVAGYALLEMANGTRFTDVVRPLEDLDGLAPGVWTVVLFDPELNNAIGSPLHFLVVADFSGKGGQVPKKVEKVSDQLRASALEAVPPQVSRINQSGFSKSALEAVKLFYEVVGVCVKSSQGPNPCRDTQWSTLYPDQKSSIKSFDSQSGRIV